MSNNENTAAEYQASAITKREEQNASVAAAAAQEE